MNPEFPPVMTLEERVEILEEELYQLRRKVNSMFARY